MCFEGTSLFGDALDKFIKEITERKALLPQRKAPKPLAQGLLPPLNKEHPIALSRLHLQNKNLALAFDARL